MKKLGFIGGGNMAEALIHGILGRKVLKPADIIASDVAAERRRKLGRAFKIATTADNLDVVRDARAILLAVKPQTIDAVLGGLAAALKRNAPGRFFISIAAGIPIARICSHLGPRTHVIRVMPNAPAMVGCGMAALVRNRAATAAEMALASRIFDSVGDAVTLKDERLLDAVTALSGSGPAYVYLFAKAMADAAASEGIPRAMAVRMALKTIEGAERVMRESGRAPAELIRVVASPGGTTEAALRWFAQAGFSDIVARAIHAAADRSRELGRIK